jgi:hypothetical protein
MNLTQEIRIVGSYRKKSTSCWSDLKTCIEKTGNMARKGNPSRALPNTWPTLVLMFCSIIIIDLDLSSTNVTDEGVVHLAELDSLKALTLSGDSITDESIPYLLRLHRLERLDLRGSGVSKEGAERLENGLPNCRIQN